MAWSWFCASDDSMIPTVRLATTKSSTTRYNVTTLPAKGTLNRQRAPAE